MANNYYDMTGVLMLKSVTPIIRALFTAFNLDAAEDATGAVYIANIAESTSNSWESVADAIDSDLFEALGITVGEFDNLGTEEKLRCFAEHFKVADKPEIVSFFENANFNEDAGLDDLVMLAQAFDDGHGLTGYRIEGCWHSSKPRLFEFGGHGDYLGKHFAVSEASSRIVSFGQRVDTALANGDAPEAATAISQHLTGMFNGISDETVRAQVQQQVVALLSSTATEATREVWSPAMGMMTDAQYKATRGCRCPSCGERGGLSGKSLEVDGGTASQAMHCSECGASWSDLYQLIGYTDLEDGVDLAGIDCVVEDVKKRGVAVSDAISAKAAISESCDVLGVDLRQFEHDIAVSKLIGDEPAKSVG